MESESHRRRLSPSQEESIDKACDRFEAAWKIGPSPRLEDYLQECSDQLLADLFEELLWIELAYREQHSDAFDPKDYERRFPKLAEHVSRVFAARHQSAAKRGLRTSGEETGRNRIKSPARPSLAVGLHIRCPHCRNPVEIAADSSFADITCSSCGSHFSLIDHAVETKSAPQLTTMGHFDLVECLGVGGFGTVWKARDAQLDRTVAVKIPRRGNLKPDELEKFLREARAAAQLKHPNIVSVHEVGRDDDTIYIVSELIRGVSLSEWLDVKRPTAREAAEFCVCLAGALGHAHERGVIHRDLKPQNILIDTDGQPHVTDFGLAKRESGEVTMTLDGQVLGTPAYMSPEQARGEGHAADARSDIYSIGVILFQLLTRELPFRGNADMLLHQVLNDEPPSPRGLNRGVPRDLETITLKCLEKDSARRYQTARDLQDDLRCFLRNEPIKARPIGPLTKAWRWRRRNPAVAGLLAAVGGALLLGAIVSSYFAVQLAGSKAQRTRDLATALISGSEALRHLRPEGYRQEVWDVIRKVQQLGQSADNRQELRREAVGTMGDFVGLQPIDHDQFPSPISAFALHPTDRQMAVGLRNGDVHVIHPENGETLGELTDNSHPVRALRYEPDGRLICVTSSAVDATDDLSSSVAYWERSAEGTWNRVDRLQLNETFGAAKFSSDGEYLVTWNQQRINIWNLRTRATVTTCTDEDLLPGRPPMLRPEGAIRSVAFCPQSGLMAVGYTYVNNDEDERGVIFWKTDESQIAKKLSLNLGSAYSNSIAFSADGRFCVFGCDRALVLYDMSSLEQRMVRRTGTVKAVTFSRDDQFFSTVDMRGQVKLWSVSTGNEVASLSHPIQGTAGEWIGFSDDRRYLAASNFDSIRVWHVGGPSERQLLDGRPDAIPTVAFRPDDLVLAVGSKDRSVSFWDPTSRQRLFELAADGQVQSVCFRQDGKLLAVAHWGGSSSSVDVWDINKRLLVARARHPLGQMNRIAFRDRHLVGTANDGVAIWEIPDAFTDGPPATIEPIKTELRQEALRCLAVAASPDGRFIAWSDLSKSDREYRVRVWDWNVGKSQPLAEDAPTMLQGWKGLTFFPDSERIAFVAKSGKAVIWNVVSREQVGSIGNDGTFRASEIALSPDGKWLALKTEPERVSVWDTTTQQEVFPFRSERTAIYAMAWNSDRTKLALGLNDGGLVLWDFAVVVEQLDSLGLGVAIGRTEVP